MENQSNDTHFSFTDEHGIDYLCPIDSVKNRSAMTDREFSECVEEDVVRRYSGNIKVQTA